MAAGVVPCQRADDRSYVPAIAGVREGLGRRGQLYVGNCKMSALQTQTCIHNGGDYYLYPLSENQLSPAVLIDDLVPVWSEAQALTVLHRQQPGGISKLIAKGFVRLGFEVRRRLSTAKTTLAGLQVGTPKRATARLTVERLLETFQGLTLTIIREDRRQRRQ